ncbi:MAG: hypothetical protein SGJ01_10000 [Gemmatimonadota bacterium]|nr:hypothetical protein [Gemmatimonadota bacterium]
MAYAGVTIFLLFFGISLLEALSGGHWVRAAFWIALGLMFWALDRKRRERGTRPEAPSDHFR